MFKILSVVALSIMVAGCSSIDRSQTSLAEAIAEVAKVEAREPNNYTFSVTINSPDTGCDRYADWWEVI